MPKGGGSKSPASSPAQSKLKRLSQLVSARQSERERLTFAVYFPRPPYRGAQYRAARGKDGLYNFTGLVLGHGGATVQRIQKASGAKVEVRDAAGNLNGAHPSSHGDPSLHAWVAATSRQRLDKAVALLLEVLQPTNTQLRPITVAPGGSAVLQPVIPADWPEAAEAAAEAAAADAEAAASDASDAEQQPSFLRSTDEEVSAALAQRIAEVASTKAPGGGSAAGSLDESEEEAEDDSVEGAGLTGPLLRELLLNKWGKAYDLSFVRRDLPLGKTLICLNVMWTHLEQRSFPMTEEDYDEKLELVALYLNSWGQAERVESFLRQPARPRKGMPSKPIVGTAISIQLDLDDAVIDEFFSQGGA